MGTIAQELGSFIAGVTPKDLPREVLERTALAVLDTIASALPGAATPNAAAMRLAGTRLFGRGDHQAWFTGETMQLSAAVLANSTAAFCLDLDDGHRAAMGHTGSAVIPAVLTAATGQNWTGPQILTAIAIGYDIAYRISASRQPGVRNNRTSGHWSGYSAAAAMGWLLGLDADQHAHAIAVTGTEAPKNLASDESSDKGMVKGSIPWSTLVGMMSVERARAGFTGPIDMFDRPQIYRREIMLDRLGSRWLVGESYMKPYACCRYIHASMDAVIELMGQDRKTSIEDLTVEIFPTALTLPNHAAPTTLESAQFSVPFCVALAALRGASAFRPMVEGALHDAEVLALAKRVTVRAAEDFKDSFPRATPGRVFLRRDGVETSRTVLSPFGDFDNQMGKKDVAEKFADLARGILSASQVRAIIEGVDALVIGEAKPLLTALSAPVLKATA